MQGLGLGLALISAVARVGAHEGRRRLYVRAQDCRHRVVLLRISKEWLQPIRLRPWRDARGALRELLRATRRGAGVGDERVENLVGFIRGTLEYYTVQELQDVQESLESLKLMDVVTKREMDEQLIAAQDRKGKYSMWKERL